jgi:hypothetical protein
MTTPPAAPRVYPVQHAGKTILYHDFSGLTVTSDALAAIAQSADLVRRQPAGSALTLTYVEGGRFNREILDALKELTAGNKPYVKAGCIVGLSGLQRVAYVAVTTFTGRRMPTFNSVDEAKDWLVAQ